MIISPPKGLGTCVHTPEEAEAFGYKIVKMISHGDIIFVNGDMGAGKTTLIRGLSYGLGVKDLVTSPTYNIINIYHGKNIDIWHADLYRLNPTMSTILELGFDARDEENVLIIEWSKDFQEYLPTPQWIISIYYDSQNENYRWIDVKNAKS